jgi:hypothetical protein
MADPIGCVDLRNEPAGPVAARIAAVHVWATAGGWDAALPRVHAGASCERSTRWGS